jgi:hypothetical protein
MTGQTNDTGLVGYDIVGTGLELQMPSDWPRVDTEACALLVLEPAPPADGFCSNVAVTVTRSPLAAGLAEWQRSELTMMVESLSDFLLIDEETVGVTMHRLLHHRVDATNGTSFGSVTVEQWARVVAGYGVTLTASCATARHPAHADLFGHLGARFRTSVLEGR